MNAPPLSPASPVLLDAIVVGAGFSGLYQLLLLRDKLGLSVKVLDAAQGVGGTWYWNRYPGARCDSESHSYAYYFSKELLDEWEWSERYPQQPEILHYLNHVADRFDLRPDILLGTKVQRAHYADTDKRWHITTDTGQTYSVKYFITAVGCLSSANIPSIAGLDSFSGQWFHTGEWPHEGVDFTGKNVGVVGTGSTGIQVIPVIAKQAKHLTVFQRTANYSIPARNIPLDDAFKRYAKENAQHFREVMTSNTNAHPFRMSERLALDFSEPERNQIYEEAWLKGGLQFRASFKDLLQNPDSNRTAADFIRNKIRQTVTDPLKAAQLCDIDHPFAAKRPPIDSGYFETFNLNHVDLVNLRETPIDCITPHGIKTSTTEFNLDVIVFATGFDAMTGSLLKMDIQGRHGVSLQKTWQAGPLNYLGLQVPGFPNMFTITGPGSPSVLCNMPPAIEHHVEWITNCIDHLQKNKMDSIEASQQASENWVATVNAAANETLLPQAKHSWYLGANVPGKPRVFMPYPGGFLRYRTTCEEIVNKGYAGFIVGREPASQTDK
ncbi:MAG: NAD(P)/FAD-dependent oxidoreductase [Burkholderiales bacterium]|nr:NAD(P)/FAD-dependent oxidoreductase [Burkholderiales bacterium]